MPRWLPNRVPRPAEPGTPRDPRAPEPGARLLPLIAALTGGALALLQLPALPSPVWLLPAVGLLLWPSRASPRELSHWRWYLAAALLGAGLANLSVQRQLEQRWPTARLGELLSLQGTIVSLPQADDARDEPGGDDATGAPRTRTWHFLFEPDDPALPHRIRVGWYRSSAQLLGGDCWRLELALRPPHGGLNPGGFDYEGWLFAQRVGAVATARSGTACGVAHGHWLLRLRQRVAERIEAWLPDHRGLPLVLALAIGDTSRLDDATWQDFRLTGTTHLIAISGFNVAIVAGLAFFVLRWTWALLPRLCLRLPAQQAGLIGSALAALVYALLAGFDPPVERAALMLLFVLAAGWFGGLAQPLRALALAWAVIVIADPLVLTTPGLWLSFGAVASIYYVGSGRLGRLPGWRAALQVQLMLSLMLAPLTLFWFQGTSLVGPLVNLAAVPVAALLTPALLAALLLAALVPALGLPALGFVASLLATCSDGLAWAAAQLPQAWIAASPAPAALLLALLGALLLFAPAGLPLRLLGALGFGALLLPRGGAPDEGGFELAALDVGQGTAVVVRTAHHRLLFDAGPAFPGGFDAGRAVVVPYLLATGARRLDRLIVSHSDLDHRGGVPAVRAAFPIGEELGALAPEPCRAGQAWAWDGVRFEILNGPAPGLSDNDGGCVLKISGARWRALLPADIEAAGEARLLASGADLRAEVLLAPHHGSRTSSSPAFIAAVQPSIVIHSAGWHHRFRHPSPEVVARYAGSSPGTSQFSTGDSGALIVIDDDIDGDGGGGGGAPRVRGWREVAGRVWSTPGDRIWAVRQASAPKPESNPKSGAASDPGRDSGSVQPD